ncbi:MAG: glycosyltransferase family 1 protein, partial [Lutibacter sp.]
MKFAIITHAVHKIKGNKIYAYEPYVREMNLWIKYVDEVQIVAPVSREKVSRIESKYDFIN